MSSGGWADGHWPAHGRWPANGSSCGHTATGQPMVPVMLLQHRLLLATGQALAPHRLLPATGQEGMQHVMATPFLSILRTSAGMLVKRATHGMNTWPYNHFSCFGFTPHLSEWGCYILGEIHLLLLLLPTANSRYNFRKILQRRTSDINLRCRLQCRFQITPDVNFRYQLQIPTPIQTTGENSSHPSPSIPNSWSSRLPQSPSSRPSPLYPTAGAPTLI